MKLTPQKVEGRGYHMLKISHPNFNRFSMIHPCDRRTDRRTGDSIYAL